MHRGAICHSGAVVAPWGGIDRVNKVKEAMRTPAVVLTDGCRLHGQRLTIDVSVMNVRDILRLLVDDGLKP